MIEQKYVNFVKRFYSELKASNLQIERSSKSNINLYKKPYGFGRCYTDHMFEVEWNNIKGWGTPKIVPFHNLSLNPGLSAIQYSISAFEGMKSAKGVDQKVRLFRPLMHLERLRNSSKKLILPDFSAVEMLECIKKLIAVDKVWHLDSGNQTFVYARPTIISCDSHLGVDLPQNAMFYVILSLSEIDNSSIALYADLSSNIYRSHGSFKIGVNYASTLNSLLMAKNNGCQQCLLLAGKDRLISEAGTMNFFAYLVNKNGDHELVTPPVDSGFLLPGITRDSILQITRKMNDFLVSEREMSFLELEEVHSDGRLLEMFCTGTASTLKNVDKIVLKDKVIIPRGPNSLGNRLFTKLNNIFYGHEECHEWTVEI